VTKLKALGRKELYKAWFSIINKKLNYLIDKVKPFLAH